MSGSAAPHGYVSQRYVPPAGAEPRWYGETLSWVPALDVTLELADGGKYSGRLITPEPEPDPETGALAMWFMIPGKPNLEPVPLAQVVAFTVHTPAPEPELGRLAKLRLLRTLLSRDLPRLAWAITTDNGQPGGPLPPESVTDENPLYEVITASVHLDRVDAEVVDHVRISIDAALHQLPGLSDLALTLPPDTPDRIAVDVLLRAPNGPDREGATRDAMDSVVAALSPIETMPGVKFVEFEYGDL